MAELKEKLKIQTQREEGLGGGEREALDGVRVGDEI